MRRSARALVLAAWAAGLAPDPVLTVSAWADEARYVAPESSPYPGKWSTDLVPYLREVMDCLSLSDPSREVVFKKSAQVAGTEAGINLFGLVVARSPAPMLIVLPTGDEVKKYVRVKLQPAIEATPELRAKVREQKSRDERGSTTTFKKFPGGYCVVTGANSSAGLQMISVRVLVLEEVSEFPADVDNRGDPADLAIARTKAYSDRRKVFWNSTPGIKGMCRVSTRYEASDRRHYHVPCPQCGARQVLEWENLRWARETAPHGAYFVCATQGCVIEAHRKAAMVAAGTWIAEAPGEGREPGFHIWQAYSPFVSWDDTVAEWLKAKGDPIKEKVFTQQVLGEAYEAKGEAPDFLKLFARREEFPLGRLPAGALFTTMGVDVQADRIEWAVWGWGIGKTSWLVDRGLVEGDTAVPSTWAKLDPLIARHYEDWQGRPWPIEAVAVDSGYNTQAVYGWTRARGDRVMAVKGLPGHLAPALGTPTRQEIDWRGEKLKRGVLLWPVGTWTLKAEFYANLRKTIAGPSEDGGFPPGYVHLPTALDETYLRQLTAEYLATRERRGYQIQEWTKARDARNEALDIRVYAGAAAVHLGLDRMTAADWQRLVAERGAPAEAAQRDLAALWAPAFAAPAFAAPAASAGQPAGDGANAVREVGGGTIERGAGGAVVRQTIERGRAH